MKKTALDTLNELSKLDSSGKIEWKERFANYARMIEKNKAKLKLAASKFHNWEPFNIYLNLSETKNSSDVFCFSLRYKGQEVADIKVDIGKNTVKIDTADYDENNKKFFYCDVCLSDEDWSASKKAKEFRNYFKELSVNKTHSKEHEYESILLTEFSKRQKTQFRGVKPVQIIKARFPMKTPLLASDKNGVSLERRPGRGGGIDLLTRTRCSNSVRLNVMELKDEYSTGEPPEKVIKQAIKYAVFIQQLLRGVNGDLWWSLFGFKRKLPSKLIINATCVMPINEKGDNDTSFGKRRIAIDGNDEIELHYLYFEDNNGTIIERESSL